MTQNFWDPKIFSTKVLFEQMLFGPEFLDVSSLGPIFSSPKFNIFREFYDIFLMTEDPESENIKTKI